MRGVPNYSPSRNYWRNGNMDFFQRATTKTVTVSGDTYIADRCFTAIGGPASKSITTAQSTNSLPTSNFPAKYCLQSTNNNIVSSFAAADYIIPFGINLEGQMVNHLNQGFISIGFWLWCSAPMQLPVAVLNGAQTLSYVQVINASAGLNFYAVYTPLTGIVIPDSNAKGFGIFIGSVSGSNYHAPALNQWVGGNLFSHPSVTNWASTTGVKFYLSQCQIREGVVPYEELKNSFSRHGGSFDQELRDCQRYCTKSYEIGTSPGAVTHTGVTCVVSSGTSIGAATVSTNLIVGMIKTPAITLYNPLTGATGSYDRSGTAIAADAIYANTKVFSVRNSAATADNSVHYVHYLADAEF